MRVRAAHTRTALIIAAAAVALVTTTVSSDAGGGNFRGETTAVEVLPVQDVLNSIRALGLRPFTQARRRGPYYVLHAYDPRGLEVRVVADAQFGDVVEIAPVLAPRYDSGPRIIHMPHPRERGGPGGRDREPSHQ
jgi:hypothetical protein